MAYIRVPPDGAGKKVQSLSHTIGADDVQTQVVHVADSADPTLFQKIDKYGAVNVSFSEGAPPLGGFGFLKITNQRALGVYESSQGTYDDLFSIVEANGGTSSYDDTGHFMSLQTTTLSGSRVLRTTNRYHYYLPGSANLLMLSIGCGDTGTTNNTRRWGAFDENDGVFFELEGSTLHAVIRSSTTGSVVNTRVARSVWNADRLDGTGTSGHVLNLSRVNIYWIDYQWLGAGRVRFGIYDETGARITCHVFENAGQNTVPYMRTGTLPLSTENVNTGITSSGTTLKECCLAIYTEGTYDDYTFWRASDVKVPFSPITGDTTLIALKAKSTAPGLNHHNSIVVFPENFSVYSTHPCEITLVQDITITSGTFTGAHPDSALDVCLFPETIKNRPFSTFFVNSGVTNISLEHLFEVNDEGILLNADGSAEIWCICANPLGNIQTGNVQLAMTYKELW